MPAPVARVQRTCEACGDVFAVRPRLVEQGRGRFCRKACKYDSAKGSERVPLEQRVWGHVAFSTPDACWPWTAARHAYGYGVMQRRSGSRWKVERAHRVVYELIHGPIVDQRAVVLHICDNPPCCNPLHLFLGDKKMNTDDMIAKGRGRVWSDRDWYERHAWHGGKRRAA